MRRLALAICTASVVCLSSTAECTDDLHSWNEGCQCCHSVSSAQIQVFQVFYRPSSTLWSIQRVYLSIPCSSFLFSSLYALNNDELVTLRPLHLNFSVYPENCILCMKVTLWDLTSAYGRSGKFPPTRAKPPLTPDDITGVRDGMVRNLAVYLRTRCREHWNSCVGFNKQQSPFGI